MKKNEIKNNLVVKQNEAVPVTADKPADKPAPKLMSPGEVLDYVEAKIINVIVPEWNAIVRCKAPNAQAIFDIRNKYANEREASEAIVMAFLMDFTPEQLDKLKEGDGVKYSQLLQAVIKNTDTFRNAMRESNIKN